MAHVALQAGSPRLSRFGLYRGGFPQEVLVLMPLSRVTSRAAGSLVSLKAHQPVRPSSYLPNLSEMLRISLVGVLEDA